jgi:short-subunit dehydrogenase
VALSHAALDGMLRRGRGHIVNISAMAGRVSFPYTEAYAAAKDGLIGLTRVLRTDYCGSAVAAVAARRRQVNTQLFLNISWR